jgi:hypothetical protein
VDRSRALLAVIVLLSGPGLACVPTRVWTVPAAKGRIHKGGTPVSDVTVIWKTWEYDDGRLVPRDAAQARTNGNGEFELTASSRLAWAVLLPAHSIAQWELTLRDGDQDRVLWHQRLYSAGPRSTPSFVSLNCDMALPLPCDLVDVKRSRLEPKRGLPVSAP